MNRSAARGGLKALLGLAAAVAVVTALALSTTAKAGLITTGSASYCDPDARKAFAPWGDLSYYARLSNGGFESGAQSWTLGGGAKVVSGNDPFYVSGNRADSHSLLLPAGSSATSSTVCFALADWYLRLMMKNVGSSTGAVRVQVVVPSLVGGLLSVLDGGTVRGNGTWAPSARLQLALSNVTSLIGTRAVAFRFTAVGTGAAYQIDDVYLDPWKGT